MFIVLTSFVCASVLVHTMWLKFNSSPTVTAVKDTHLALYSLPFPAVNVCPMDKIKRSAAHSYVAARTKGPYEANDTDFFLNALTLFQHPLYNRMLNYLKSGTDGFLTRLAGINITDLMLAVSIIGTRRAGTGIGLSGNGEIEKSPDDSAPTAILLASDGTKSPIKTLKNYADGF